ncbi:MAG: hypothetical protein JOZ73_10420 [Solirubrobacterales bacterium]|nr:hypothetical protein [Solirubrobacterales bacterium]
MSKVSEHLTIRRNHPDGGAAIVRLAALAGAPVPPSPFLLAEVDGELRAALSLASGRVIADPFHPSFHLTALLRVHSSTAESERPAARARRYRRGRLALVLRHEQLAKE